MSHAKRKAAAVAQPADAAEAKGAKSMRESDEFVLRFWPERAGKNPGQELLLNRRHDAKEFATAAKIIEWSGPAKETTARARREWHDKDVTSLRLQEEAIIVIPPHTNVDKKDAGSRIRLCVGSVLTIQHKTVFVPVRPCNCGTPTSCPSERVGGGGFLSSQDVCWCGNAAASEALPHGKWCGCRKESGCRNGDPLKAHGCLMGEPIPCSCYRIVFVATRP